MITKITLGWGVVLSLLLSNGQAQSFYTVKSVKASVLGSSTLHDWESDITKVECKGHFEVDNNVLRAIKDVQVKIPVESIKSKEGKLMDSKTYEAFKYEENPLIIYEAANVEVIMKESGAVIKAKGNLTMAGVTKEVELIANGKFLANGDLEVDVTKNLKMTEYSMTPPTAVLGTIKVGDEVTIKATLVFTTADSLTSINSK